MLQKGELLMKGNKIPDINCPYMKYLFDNLLRTDTGANRCLVQGLQPEDVNYKTYDYPVCNLTNHEECQFFKQNKLETALSK